MKTIFTFLYSIFSTFLFAQGEFITKWQLPAGKNSLMFYVERTGGDVNYTWETVPASLSGAGVFAEGDGAVTITGLPENNTILLKMEGTNLKHFYVLTTASNSLSPDVNLLEEVQQWGSAAWSSMNRAFNKCKNMDVTATDIPNLQNVTDMSWMFFECTSLLGPDNINSWDVSNVTTMESLFTFDSMFNQSVSNWDMHNVKSISQMFAHCTLFNHPLNNWDTSAVEDMNRVFFGATSFNQPLDNWDTTNVKYMNALFNDATSFNQNIGNWNLPNLNVLISTFLLSNCGMSCYNYSQTLLGWSANPNTASNINLYAHGLQYDFTMAQTARNILINVKGWTIQGDSGTNCSLGTDEYIADNGLTAYPNPVENTFSINVKDEQIKSVQVYNISGSLILNNEGINNNYAELNLSNLETGCYFVKISLGNNTVVNKKLIKK